MPLIMLIRKWDNKHIGKAIKLIHEIGMKNKMHVLFLSTHLNSLGILSKRIRIQIQKVSAVNIPTLIKQLIEILKDVDWEKKTCLKAVSLINSKI